jgi:Skp family chaperone for outer membrane proteins
MKWMTAILLASALLFGGKSAVTQTARVGSFDRQAIVLAYYRSPQWAETLHQKRMELNAAKQANDQQTVAKLDKWFGDAQELAHKQLWGNAPIDNIISAIAPATEELCKSENLSMVVPAPAQDGATQTVDVTAQLLDWLKADDKTRDLIGQMHQK